LYIQVKQVGELGSFSRLKLLYYKDGKVIDSDSGYFSVYAENLNGVGSTDTMEIWCYGTDYDDIEFFYEK
jgi:hypothetical protein